MNTALILFLGIVTASPAAESPDDVSDIFADNQALGRGVNLGNALEAPREGEWGMTLKSEYFDLIQKAGFDSVRIPIRWSAHAQAKPPFTIDPQFFERVDWAIEQALSRNLATVINVHHYDGLDRDPDGHKERFLAIWKQIAERYRDHPDQLSFELMNEPHDNLTHDRWNALIPAALAVVRESNPVRAVIIGPANWNSVGHLDRLELPEDDRRIIATFHYYKPFEFTHQGASWVDNADRWLGTSWKGSEAEVEAIRADFQKAADWSERHNRPLYLGEFGAYSRSDRDSRARWTRALVIEADRRGFSTSYWEFGAGFGVYDRDNNTWREPLKRALLGDR